MPSAGSLFALPFPLLFTYVRKDEKLLVNLLSLALVPEAKPSILHSEMQQDGDIYIARGTFLISCPGFIPSKFQKP